MQRWYLKSLLGRTFGRSRFGTASYRLATNYLLRTQMRAPWKWCMWFREHLLLARRYAGLKISESNLWLMDPGWTAAPQLLAALASDRLVMTTERRQPVLGIYNRVSAETVQANLWTLGKNFRVPEHKAGLIEAVSNSRGARSALAALNSHYYRLNNAADEDALSSFSGRVDICMSMGVLEHYRPVELEAAVARMARMVRPGGCVSHIIDHRDHFYHADASISPWHHLYYSPEAWRRLADNHLFYINRLLQSDYVRLFDRYGFDILYLGSKPYPEQSPAVEMDRLYGGYRQIEPADLGATVSHIVAVRRPFHVSTPARRIGEPATSRLPRSAITERYAQRDATT